MVSKSNISKYIYSKFPILFVNLRKVKNAIRKAMLRFSCYLYDFDQDVKHLNWDRRENQYWKLSSELFFFYHKVEKGLCLPVENMRYFGEDAVRRTLELLGEWQERGFSQDDPVYLAAISALQSWKDAVIDLNPKTGYADLSHKISDLGNSVQLNRNKFATPIFYKKSEMQLYDHLLDIAESRRSVRSYDGQAVNRDLVLKALRVAQLSPSACNRQPVKVHLFEASAKIQEMLSLQNGNKGFNGTIPLLAVITADQGTFFDSSERSEPILDGGLFLMSFILAIQSVGLSSCCLNWCVPPDVDIEAHRRGGIPFNERILTFLAIGRTRDDAVVPLSARRSPDSIVVWH